MNLNSRDKLRTFINYSHSSLTDICRFSSFFNLDRLRNDLIFFPRIQEQRRGLQVGIGKRRNA